MLWGYDNIHMIMSIYNKQHTTINEQSNIYVPVCTGFSQRSSVTHRLITSLIIIVKKNAKISGARS